MCWMVNFCITYLFSYPPSLPLAWLQKACAASRSKRAQPQGSMYALRECGYPVRLFPPSRRLQAARSVWLTAQSISKQGGQHDGGVCKKL